ncbi:MAG: DUF429 domain-containing protein [Candidatus Hydrogenedentes bacterium]|nr:DUF429 domain-containing protein [Candidatus Hydrogenedentota bacterium]
MWMREIHPEVCFWAWNGEKPMANNKKIPAGRAEREGLVRRRYSEAYDAVRLKLPLDCCANDDILDAFAALWSAERLVEGKALILPSSPPLDSFGLRMEMIA